MALPEIETDQIVEKSDFSSAGRGNRLNRVESSTQQGRVVTEPWVERVFDYSVQFEYDGETLRNLGMIRQLIGPQGQYQGSVWRPKFLAGVDSKIARLMANEVMPLYAPNSKLGFELRSWLDETGFTGAFGIDGFVYKMPDGTLRPRVICEINPRYTMGRVTLELARFISPGRGVTFRLEKANGVPTSDFETDASGKLLSGKLVLNEVDEDTFFAVVIEVS